MDLCENLVLRQVNAACATFYATKYVSAADYARWIAEVTGLPAFDLRVTDAQPEDFDFLVLGSAVIH